jgi:hypothetical protein
MVCAWESGNGVFSSGTPNPGAAEHYHRRLMRLECISIIAVSNGSNGQEFKGTLVGHQNISILDNQIWLDEAQIKFKRWSSRNAVAGF